MTAFMDVIRSRRSIRVFDQKPVEDEKVAALIEAALRSPSSRGLNPWQFVVVTEAETRKALSEVKPHGGGFLASSPLALAIVADPERCDVWVEDTSIAATYIKLAGEFMGLKSCWCQIRLRQDQDGKSASDKVRAILDIPEGFEVAAIIGIGYPAEDKPGHPESYLDMGKVHRERFLK
ncbi:MAG: nitroreductase family protein [Desulfobacterales bacterium]|nr:nitroreductase family protein [Desulfobacterales bacterium]